MKRNSVRLLSSVLTICMMLSMCSSYAFATVAPSQGDRSSDYLDSYQAGTYIYAGKVVVSVSVDAVVNATMIGARDIYLYESTNGVDFTCVKHYNYQNYPNMMGSGWYYARDAVDDYNRVAGRYYYALVYVYAADSTGYDCRTYATATVH